VTRTLIGCPATAKRQK